MTFQEAMLISQTSGLIFLKYGLHCIGCHMAADESIEDGAKAHGLSDTDIDKMIKEVNDILSDKDKKAKKSTK
ncbi:disulfide oxidoreductase [Candidatus Woesearchaeota archaeon]|nr:disulfide oxidoreductase [Candidatus Woesearchaeota archaeon]MBT4114581.1 disulfide oxidoreductase [Candidatus Woesearchaeota archaeon]MBT4248248.1 disulfide oxidoreductase [Candidatus Woesearchaeota archaeon]